MRLKSRKISDDIVLDTMRRSYSSIDEYGVELDWMGYEMDEDENQPVYHHIISEKDGGNDDISNGAVLGRYSRHMLHQLRTLDPELYNAWNEVFAIINRIGAYPSEELWNTVMSLQVQTEQVLKSDSKVLRK